MRLLSFPFSLLLTRPESQFLFQLIHLLPLDTKVSGGRVHILFKNNVTYRSLYTQDVQSPALHRPNERRSHSRKLLGYPNTDYL